MFNTQELNKAYYDLSQSTQDNLFTILYGGRNSGKSHSAIQWVLKKLWNTSDSAIWYRATSTILKEKAYQPIVSVASQKGVEKHLKCTFHNLSRQITFPKGNRLLFDYIEESGKSKGTAGITYIIIDEVDQITLAEFLGVVTSYRADPNIRFILMFNPVSDKHWLKKTFFDNMDDGTEPRFKKLCKTFHYTIEDNKFATALDYDMLDALQDQDKNQYRIQRLGEWGSLSIDDPFVDAFSYNVHVVEDNVMYFPDYPLIISFDFGKTESCTIGQYFHDYDIESDPQLQKYFTKEGVGGMTRIRDYRVGGSQSNVDVILNSIVAEFGNDVEYEIIGDTSGGSDPYSKFSEIRRLMEDLGCAFLHFPKRIKPKHIASRAVTNWLFRTLGSNYKVSINCPTLIDDLMGVRVDEYGNINKADCVLKNIGHCMDSSRYIDFNYAVKDFHRHNIYYAEEHLGKQITTFLDYN